MGLPSASRPFCKCERMSLRSPATRKEMSVALEWKELLGGMTDLLRSGDAR